MRGTRLAGGGSAASLRAGRASEPDQSERAAHSVCGRFEGTRKPAPIGLTRVLCVKATTFRFQFRVGKVAGPGGDGDSRR